EEVFFTVKPNNKLLRQYIAYYYFHKCEVPSVSKKFIYYPNTKNALTIYRASSVEFGKLQSNAIPDSNCPFFFSFGGVESFARYAAMQSPFNKIGIVFHPLGINHFLSIDLVEVLPKKDSRQFDYFKSTMCKVLPTIYEMGRVDSKVSLLDEYFLTQYHPFNENRLIKAIQILLEGEEKISVTKLAQRIPVSRRTLLRLFQKHLGCSVKHFMDVVQFRKAVVEYEQKRPHLTSLAHGLGYYDQSEFIHHFKKITGFNPKKFFKHISHMGEEDTFWTFL
ncbi:MAG: AraC family transcriptional regulator, partial [Bacteroidota bacterium]